MRCFFMIASLLLISMTYAQDDTGADKEKTASNEKRDTASAPVEKFVESGFVFVDGCYLEAPYRFRTDEKRLYINDLPFDQSSFESLASKKTLANGRMIQRASRLLRETLESGGVVVLFAESPVAQIYGTDSYDLLRVLVDDDARASFSITDLRRVYSGAIDQEVWKAFVRDFDCPQELRERSAKLLAKIRTIEESNARQRSARLTLQSSAYPLSVVGMLLVVLAFGHLLKCKTDSEGESAEKGFANCAVTRSLTLVAAMSALDLSWTMLVGAAGDMKELNPLGAALIDDAVGLIAFKTCVTLMAVLLLYSLRQHRSAKEGAWWSCLICTLLTVRWLTFNSMFV
ncbi:MAG: hypothetical protein GY878_13870 [Fuerstiella sp.]|nr:hypothetical protein [Fuerstiella sp.]